MSQHRTCHCVSARCDWLHLDVSVSVRVTLIGQKSHKSYRGMRRTDNTVHVLSAHLCRSQKLLPDVLLLVSCYISKEACCEQFNFAVRVRALDRNRFLDFVIGHKSDSRLLRCLCAPLIWFVRLTKLLGYLLVLDLLSLPRVTLSHVVLCSWQQIIAFSCSFENSWTMALFHCFFLSAFFLFLFLISDHVNVSFMRCI